MKMTLGRRLEKELDKMRRLAKNSAGGHAKTFWVGYDQACFELQKRFIFDRKEEGK
jgi:hypothetical protein